MRGTFEDLTGKQFGQQLVLGRAPHPDAHKRTAAYWWVRCLQCSKQHVVETRTLRKITSKGCRSCNRQLPEGEAAIRSLLCRYKASATERGIAWELTDSQFRALISSPCYYTGREPSQTFRTQSGSSCTYNGIDRLDSAKGYTQDNCVPCCSDVNYAKQELTFKSFIELCKQVVARHP